MTVSSGLDLRVSRSLELLARLRETALEFSKREDQLSRELSSRRYTTSRKFRDGIEKTESRLATQIVELETLFKEGEERVRSIFEARRARIQGARASGLRSLPKRAQEAKQRWMGEIQMRQFRAERHYAADMEAADKEFARATAELRTQGVVLTGLRAHARRDFRGYWTLLRLLSRAPIAVPESEGDPGEPEQGPAELGEKLTAVEEQLGAFRKFLLARLFSQVPPEALVALIVFGGALLAWRLGPGPAAPMIAGAGVAVLLVLLFLLYRAGLREAKTAASAIAEALAEAGRIHATGGATVEAKHEQDRQRIKDEYDRACAEIRRQWKRADDIEAEFERAARWKIEKRVPRAFEKNAKLLVPRLRHLETEQGARLQRIKAEAEARKRQIAQTHEAEMAALVAEEQGQWDELEAQWKGAIVPLYEAIDAMNAETAATFPPWERGVVQTWVPPTNFTPATKFARLEVDLAQQADALPKDPRLALPGAAQVSIPLSLNFPKRGSLLFEMSETGGAIVMGAINNVILRLLSTTPPGKLSFTIIDPVGLGQNFAGFMHLSDYEESLINRRIWTQRDQIDERLAELSAHIEKVIQMYLRNEYATITEYNAQAGSVAEKYHFLVVADFPTNFSETAARRLQSIALSGPRCGIYTLIHWDRRQPLPDGFDPNELRKNSVCILREKGEFVLATEWPEAGAALIFDAPPDPELAVEFVHKIGKSSIDSNRVEVPFAQIAPAPSELWAADTTSELKIAIGRTGATKHQYLAIGKGTRQHALFAGKTGSGKSTLFHVIITNLALTCSPAQVEFYLIDFKKGVEFKCYASKRLPHARVVAIESDREFALSVLQRVDEELKRRGDMFRRLGVQDIAGYKKAGGTEQVPRSLLIIDEFQEFFVDDDVIAQTASLLFDRIVRQGRAFGIHVLLGSQSLGGAYSLARATIGQMVIRVALQCNEADAYLIMDDSNSAPRLLSRPGEGIYNDAGGAVEGNSPFQVVWLSDDERDTWLDKVRDFADQHHDHHPSPIVFEGNAPADIGENDLLRLVFDAAPAVPKVARAWLGAPNSIKGPTEVVFHRQSGHHLLIVGQREDASLNMLGLSLLALGAQYPVGTAKFIFFHTASPGTPDAEVIARILRTIPHPVTVAGPPDLVQVMNEVATELKARSGGEAHAAGAPSVFVFIHGLHRFKKLRQEDEFAFSTSGSEGGSSPSVQFNDLINEGSSLGLHLITTVDTFNNVNRFMNRKALSEFEMRVVFQMSANDSASLIDSPKASNLGLHRAVFYNEHEGSLETFRPYAPPDTEWLEVTAEKLARRGG
ncbi:MAG: segregation ATPase FtsK/SpoIIIE, family [Chthoniobacter sp.]|jgi:DNA segregation ATPase FtsK/SpoIIIE-like protein|nr:segregation ATPase FtsK/SpoIIIE, family [Chthoniobacter sp.]